MAYERNPVTGRMQFRTEDGRFVIQDGQVVSAEEADINTLNVSRVNNQTNQSGQTPTPPTGQATDIEEPRESSDNRTSSPEPFNQNQELIKGLLDQAIKLSNPEIVNQLEDARLGREQALANTYGDLARKRDIEMQNIRSWQAIQQAQIQKEAVLAASLASTAYLANTPNANTLAGLNTGAQIAANAFKA